MHHVTRNDVITPVSRPNELSSADFDSVFILRQNSRQLDSRYLGFQSLFDATEKMRGIKLHIRFRLVDLSLLNGSY